MTVAATDVISLAGISVDCFIGIHPHERSTRQPLVVDVELGLSTREAAASGALSKSVDYSVLAGDIHFLLEACRFHLLETAAEALCRYLLAPPTGDRRQAQVQWARIILKKPRALPGGAVAGLSVRRTLAEVETLQETNHYGIVDVIHESRDSGIYRLRIPPQGGIPAHHHASMDEAELALSPGLLINGQLLPAGRAHFWPKGVVHVYENPTDTERTLLCVDRPAFLPEDELLLSDESPPTTIPRGVSRDFY